MLEEGLGLWLWGENGRNSYQDPCAKSFPILQELSVLGRAHLSEWQELLCPYLSCLSLVVDHSLIKLTMDQLDG